jgi:hypothetical protein
VVVKASLLVALLYFVSPIAMNTLQAKSIYDENANRLEFFKAPQIAPLRQARTIETTTASKTLSALQDDKTQTAGVLQTLCAGLENAKQPGAFCATYLPATLLTLNDLESSGSYACESKVPASDTFEFETATTLSGNDQAPTGPVQAVATVAAVEVVAALVRIPSFETPNINQCIDREIDMTDISLLISSITTAMK